MKWTFVCEEHEDYGMKGWREKRHPNFDPLGGLAVAHDVLEHFRDDDDGPAGELQAHGAMVWIRGMNGQFGNPIMSPAEVSVSEFPNIFRHWRDEDMNLPDPPRRNRPQDSAEREFIDDMIHHGRRLLMSEFLDHGGEVSDEDRASIRADIEKFLVKARGWMLDGLAKVKKRYRKFQSYDVALLFKRIEARADELLKFAEEGDEMVVCVVGLEEQLDLIEQRRY